MFKFNDKESLKTFKELTSNTNQLSKIFDTHKDLNTQTKAFIKRLKGFTTKSFEKLKYQINLTRSLIDYIIREGY